MAGPPIPTRHWWAARWSTRAAPASSVRTVNLPGRVRFDSRGRLLQVLPLPWRVQGQVLDEAGQPVAGARVRVVRLHPDDFSDETVLSLMQLKDIGVPLGNVSLTTQRDWRVLASGLSFGLLFLAAARGILRQEVQQRDDYFKLERHMSYYENLMSALRIEDRLSREEKEPPAEIRKRIEVVIDRLMEKPFESTGDQITEKQDTGSGFPFEEQTKAFKETLDAYIKKP